jgi:general secretion pathway protein A
VTDGRAARLAPMYQEFYGLRERPFGLTSNLKYLLMTAKHREALSNLAYGISTGTGITLLLGEPGTGKTTVLRKAVASYLQGPGPHPPVRGPI